MNFPKVAISDLVTKRTPKKDLNLKDSVWCLNLDQIESNSGTILSRSVVFRSELGPSTYHFEAGTVLYSKLRPYLNKVVVAEEDGFATTELVPLVCDQSKIYPHFLAYFLRSNEFLNFANTVVAGAKMPRMVMSEFWQYKIPLPPLAEQRRIAAILDQADALRSKRRESLTQLETLKQSIFLDMFGQNKNHPRQTLEELCELITDGTHQTPTYADEGVIFLSAKNVTTGSIDWLNVKFIPNFLHKELHRRLAPQKDDILLAKNGTTGVAAIVDRECVFDIYVSLALLRPRQGILASYLHAAINSAICRSQFNSSLKGIGVPNLHLKEIRLTKVPVPTMKQQQQFALHIHEIESLRKQHETSLNISNSLFASLQHRAFRGEL